MKSIEVDDDTAAGLDHLAASRGGTVADYLRTLVLTAAEKREGVVGTPEPFDAAAYDEVLAKLQCGSGSPLPSHFSRADIYGEHD